MIKILFKTIYEKIELKKQFAFIEILQQRKIILCRHFS